MPKGLLLGILVVSLLGLVGISVYGARAEMSVRGVSALHVDRGRVFIGVARKVLVADEAGRRLGVLSSVGGDPWLFDDPSGVTVDEGGRIFVADAGRHEIVRFDPDFSRGTVIARSSTRFGFELEVLGDKLVVGDTMAHELRLVGPSGETQLSRKIMYPNGLSRLRNGPPAEPKARMEEVLLLAATGRREVLALDHSLKPLSIPSVQALNAYLARGGTGPSSFRHLLDLSVGEDNALCASLCRTTSGECTLVRVSPDGTRIDPVADLGFVLPDPTNPVDDFLQVLETGFTSRGNLLVASPRLSSVFVFEGPAGPLPGGFCEQCTTEELERNGASVEKLVQEGVTWTNGVRISLFGDAELRNTFIGIRKARQFYFRLQRAGQAGAIVVALGLLVALFLLRQTGAISAPKVQARLNEVWSKLIRPEAGNLAAVGSVIAGAALLGAVAGAITIGTAGALGGAAVGGLIAARIRASPILLRRRDPRRAREAFDLYLGSSAARPIRLLEGEQVVWASYAIQRQSRRQLGAEVLEASRVDDPIELLEHLVPRLSLVVCTTERLFVVATSIIGAPLDDVQAWVREGEARVAPPVAPGRLLILQGAALTEFEMPARAEGAASSTDVSIRCLRSMFLCRNCSEVVGTCPHGVRHVPAALALTAVLPGLGHLVQRRWGAARITVIVALGFLIQAYQFWEPQHWGVVPSNPWEYGKPLLGYLGLLATAMFDVLRHARVMARRAGRVGHARRRRTPSGSSHRRLWPYIGGAGAIAILLLAAGIGWWTFSNEPIPSTPTYWDEKVTVRHEGAAPAGYVANRFAMYDARPTTPHVRLATVRIANAVLKHQELVRRRMYWEPVRHAVPAANVYTIEGIDQTASGLPEGWGELIHGLYLLHAGKVPPDFTRVAGQLFCQVTAVMPGQEFERAGVIPGDLMVDVDDRHVLPIERQTDPFMCRPIVDALQKPDPGSEVVLSVIRDGQRQTVRLVRPTGMYGFRHQEVPELVGLTQNLQGP